MIALNSFCCYFSGQIFSQFCKEKTEDEKRALWNEKIVYKMNDKIRGIKNGKYKSKK